MIYTGTNVTEGQRVRLIALNTNDAYQSKKELLEGKIMMRGYDHWYFPDIEKNEIEKIHKEFNGTFTFLTPFEIELIDVQS